MRTPSASSPAKNCSGRAMPQKATTGPGTLGISMRRRRRQIGPFHPHVAEFGFEIGIVCRDGEDVCPQRCIQCFAQVAGWEKMVVPIFATDEKNVDVAVELTVLETVIEDVYERSFVLACVRFGEYSGIVALGGNVDGHASLARDQQRLVAELVRRTVEVNAEWNRGAATIAARKNIDVESALGKESCQCDG